MDCEACRGLFPVVNEPVYLNHAGVAPTSVRVVEAIHRWVHRLATEGLLFEPWLEEAEEVRRNVAELVGACAHEIAFIRNTSHGLALVAEGLDWRAGDEVAVCTQVEYPSNVYPWLYFGSRRVRVAEIEPVADGVTLAAFERALSNRTRVLTLSAVQYASGHRADLEAIGQLCADRGVLFCVDGIQIIGAQPLDVKKSGIHFLSAESHKWMLGTPGIGFLFVDESVCDQLRPILVGWKSATDAATNDVSTGAGFGCDFPNRPFGHPVAGPATGLGENQLESRFGINQLDVRGLGSFINFIAVVVELNPSRYAAGLSGRLPMTGMALIAPDLEVIVAHIVRHVRRQGVRIQPAHRLRPEAVIVLVQIDGALGPNAMTVIDVASAAVVDDVVTEITRGVFAVRGHARDAAGVVSPKIVVHRNSAIVFGRGDHPIVVGAFAATLIVGFLDRAPLHRHVMRVVQIDDLVVAPAQGQVIEDDVIRAGLGGSEAAELDAVAAGTDVAPAPDAEMANDDVVNAVIIAGDDTLDRLRLLRNLGDVNLVPVPEPMGLSPLLVACLGGIILVKRLSR